MTQAPNPLAGYEDWLPFMQASTPFESRMPDATSYAAVLGIPAPPPSVQVSRGESFEVDGLEITRLEWHVGFGPRTRAYVLRPVGSDRLPGVLGLHCHGGFKWLGAEQLIDLGSRTPREVAPLQRDWYGGRAPANELARRGFAVLVHDAFLWGSRRFPLREHTPKLAGLVAAQEALWHEQGVEPTEAERYNAIASFHEDTVAKAAGVLGTSLAGTVAYDDLVALEVLAGLPEVDASRMGAFGFSGGGGRSLMLAALDERIRANVVTCMMATFESLTPVHLDTHSWLLNSPGLWKYSDLPGLVRGEATLVQYGLHDPLFVEQGMRDAHAILTKGTPGYRGSFHDVGHEFGVDLQAEAWGFLVDELA